MKRIYLIGLVLCSIAALSGTALASSYDCKCLNHKGKFSKCTVNVDNGHLVITYKSKNNQDLNEDIPGANIRALTAGEYSRRRVAEALILTPWLLFSKKKRDQIGVEYLLNDNNTPKATMIELKTKYGLALKTELKAISGKEIQEAPTEKKK